VCPAANGSERQSETAHAVTEKSRVFSLVTGAATSHGAAPRGRPPALPPGCLGVSELGARLKGQLEQDGELQVGGEVTGFKVLPNGHWSFELKDARAKIKVFTFFNTARRLAAPKDGELVVVTALPTFKADFGVTQLIASRIAPIGDGDLKKRLEALTRKLAEAGCFDVARKRPLPRLPRVVGIATSLQAAALRDVLTVIGARNPHTHVVIRDCRVQGDGAAADVADAIRRLDQSGLCDVILVVRGGGAREDLSAFDTEPVVRAIVGCQVPVVAGVGHEIDTTLADLAADVRAATPSQAAELAVPVFDELVRKVDRLEQALRSRADGRVADAERRLARVERRLPAALDLLERHGAPLRLLERRLARQAPQARLQERAAAIDGLGERLHRRDPRARVAAAHARVDALAARLDAAVVARRNVGEARLEQAVAALDALSPLAVLRRGWGLVTVPGEGRRLARGSDLVAGRRLHLKLDDGEADVIVAADDDTP
jgi:exodeoxyribonuclease VII large subunit